MPMPDAREFARVIIENQSIGNVDVVYGFLRRFQAKTLEAAADDMNLSRVDGHTWSIKLRSAAAAIRKEQE